ncbi:hypothetical protein ACQ4PT_043856 [Festuca glaucescens]
MTTPRATAPRRMGSAAAAAAPAAGEPYNILPIHDLLAEHPSLRFPEVRAAAAALRAVGGLRPPPYSQWRADQDLMDWLGAFFGFQRDSVRNQREHLVLLLANAQMRLSSADFSDTLEPRIARALRKKLLRNYDSWCGFLGRRANVYVPDDDPRADLLYAGLHLLVWGEAANLRFMPECLCYVYHHMALELHRILEGFIDTATGRPANPAVNGDGAFLARVVAPIYGVVSAEVTSSRNGTAPHAAWRNYDDINEYFWRRDVFDRLGWPMEQSRQFFRTPPDRSRVRKTGFVEVRSFWNIYRSFDRLWVMLVLYLQAAAIVAWNDAKWPWQNFDRRAQVRVLSVFITWAALRFLQSLLDIGTQFRRAFRDGRMLAVRMVLKAIAAAVWVLVFAVLYKGIWNQRDSDRGWSLGTDSRIMKFLYAAAVFLLPEALATLLFIIPWVRNALEKTNWKICYALTWWFQSRSFVGRGLREGTWDNVKYSIFWVLLLAVKFTFSYFLQIRPLVKPTKEIDRLSKVAYAWHEFFGQSNRFAVFILWLPVVLIYLMDIQIWYAIFSSMAGAFVGLFAHLGEIRDMKQLRLRFQFFASAMSFNIMPEEQHVNERTFLPSRLRNFWQRLQLRYGFSRSFRKIESNQVEARRFALIWNEIISKFREEDIVSDLEVELLELPPELWNVRVIRWPCFLLCNELSLALGQAKEVPGPDRRLWRKICKNDYRRCAVIEVYDSTKYLLLEIIKERSEEHGIVTQLFREFDESMHLEKFTVEYKMSVMQNVHAKLVALLSLLLKPNKDITKIVNALQTLYDVVIRDFQTEKRSMEQLRNEGLAQSRPTSLLFVDTVVLPDEENATFYKQVRRMHTILTSRDSMVNIPKNLEARRRIAFFSNSLFMNIPRATQVEKMMAFSVLTPYYNEEVLYNKDQLYKENEDGISILYYLQQIYPDEWEFFVERMKREGMSDIKELYSEKHRLRDLRHWVSYRGQTLSRTVRGMMYYYDALKMLTFLDSASEHDLRTGSRELARMGSSRIGSSRRDGGAGGSGYYSRASSSRTLSRATSGVSSLFKGSEYGTVLMKYTYVVACQIYGQQKAKNDPHAYEILELMKNYEALRVAYVDEKHLSGGETEYFSVLVKYDQQLQQEVEIYRVKLPGPLKLGEGKPENQNHALIFTRGDAVQTIDMNQDNYFEEALKMRNLLEEFNRKYGIRKPKILGVREHVFTGSVSSLAWFMSAQETSFVTLGQRVLANPLKVRMHYGHPDVFDRLWFLGRGGISKASRVINISEDIFAGFNCTLRGGNVTHHEYIQVGKGRDVGLNQVSMFEAKVASGNGEQTLSRDVYRLGHRLDFFRMLSFFYTTIGFYLNTMMVVLTVYAFVWGRFYLALSGLEDYISKNASSTNNAALGAVLNQQFVIQLGLFTALPMIIENSLEHGFLNAVWDFLKMQLQFASVFYTFSMGTKTHYYGRTILHGGAKYRATGRGFVVEHKKFAENYRLYARSHFLKAIELGVILVLYASYTSSSGSTLVYILLTLSSWFLVGSWILAPFIFNPSGLDWLKNFNDFEDFLTWIWFQGGISVKSDQSWEKWWEEETDHLRTSGLWGSILEIIIDLRYFFFQYAIVYRLHIAGGSRSILVYLLSWTCILLAFVALVTVAYFRDRYSAKKHIRYRFVQAVIVGVTVTGIVLLIEFTKFQFIDALTSLLAFLPTGWGIISIALVFKPYLRRSETVWKTIVTVARLYDIMFGVIVMTPVAVLSWLPGLQEMQTRILFNEAFSRGLHISQMVTGAKKQGV